MKQQVHGNVTGVRDTLIEALGQLYDYEVDEDTFLPRELMQVLARFTGVLNREIAVYITRDGEVVDVSIGTDRDVELRDYRLRRNTQRLSCVRCIHTHPNGDGRLSDVDLSALRSFRYDAMVAIGCLKGEPTFVQSAFLVEKQNLLMDEPVRWYKTPDNDWMRAWNRWMSWRAWRTPPGRRSWGNSCKRRISRIRRCSSGAGARMNCAGSVRRWKLICAFLTRN